MTIGNQLVKPSFTFFSMVFLELRLTHEYDKKPKQPGEDRQPRASGLRGQLDIANVLQARAVDAAIVLLKDPFVAIDGC